MDRWLESHHELREIYRSKEQLNALYRTKGRKRAETVFNNLLHYLQLNSGTPELKKLHKTLSRWRDEILNYFDTGLTNAMSEGFDNKAKLLKKQGYGYKNQDNFNQRLLSACYF